jgi:penicillin-binding protein 1C
MKAWVRRPLIVAAVATGVTVWIFGRPYPVDDLRAGFPDSIRIRDAEGGLLREVVNEDGARAQWTPLDQISPLVAQATVAVEDARFFSHRGVDGIGLARAIRQDIGARHVVSGASTLSMQLSRLVHPHPRTLIGKLAEMVDAIRMERAFSKRAILEQYLNRAPYGAGAVGVEAASQRYFGMPSLDLSLAEAALLAGLPKGPTELNPFRNEDAAVARQRLVLSRMLRTGVAGPDDVSRALREPLQLASTAAPAAMHFTDWVVSLNPAAGDVATTLDRDFQIEVEKLVAEHVKTVSLGGATQAAVVVLDNRRCDVIAMVGSADYWNSRSGSVNGALAKRQPGSTLKPFTYALAFERGFSPASVVADVETRYGDAAGALFVPKNYSEEFSGPVLMSEALGRSLNIPALRVAAEVGPEALLERLRTAGFSSLDQPASFYGLGLTLGNGEVTLLELAQAYAALARGGLTCVVSPFANRPATPAPIRVFSPDVAYLVTDVLSDEALRVRAFGPANALMLGFPVAVKTGTSTNWRDNWAVGYTPEVTVAVWVGDFEGRTMNHLAGVSGAGPLFHNVMKLAVRRAGRTPRREEPPEGIVEVTVCATSGRKAGAHCPTRRTVHLRRQDVPTEECPWHKELALDRRNGLLAGEHCPSQFVMHQSFEVLPPTYAAWQADRHAQVAPTRYSPLCPAKGPVRGAAVITYPRPHEVFLVEPGYDRRTQTLELSAEVDPSLPELTWLVDDKPVASAPWPYRANWELEAGTHRLQAVAGHLRSDPVAFEVR